MRPSGYAAPGDRRKAEGVKQFNRTVICEKSASAGGPNRHCSRAPSNSFVWPMHREKAGTVTQPPLANRRSSREPSGSHEWPRHREGNERSEVIGCNSPFCRAVRISTDGGCGRYRGAACLQAVAEPGYEKGCRPERRQPRGSFPKPVISPRASVATGLLSHIRPTTALSRRT